MGLVTEIIEDLERRKSSVACCGDVGLLSLLSKLGFQYRSSKNSIGHTIFTHPELTRLSEGEFATFSIDCGHRPKKEMKKPYVVKAINILKKYEQELTTIALKEGNSNV